MTRPGKPTDNAFIETVSGKFRAECLNAHWFLSVGRCAPEDGGLTGGKNGLRSQPVAFHKACDINTLETPTRGLEPMPDKDEQRPGWRNVVTIAAGSLLVLHLALKYGRTLGGGPWPDSSGLDAPALALVTLALLPWIATHLTSAKLPGGIEFAFRDVQRRQELNEQAITQLRFVVEGTLTRHEYQHLLNIRDNVEYEIEGISVSALRAELRRLRGLGLIEGGVGAFTAAYQGKRRIGDWFRLTPRGNEYLKMREEEQEA